MKVTRSASVLLAVMSLLIPAAGPALAGDMTPSPDTAKELTWPKIPASPLAQDYPGLSLGEPPAFAGLAAAGVSGPIDLSVADGALIARGTGARADIAVRIQSGRSSTGTAGAGLAPESQGAPMRIDIQGFQPGSVVSVWTSSGDPAIPAESLGAMVVEMDGRDAGRWKWQGDPAFVHVMGIVADGSLAVLTIPVEASPDASASAAPGETATATPSPTATEAPSSMPSATSTGAGPTPSNVSPGGTPAASAADSSTNPASPSPNAANPEAEGEGGFPLWILLVAAVLVTAAVVGFAVARRRGSNTEPPATSEPEPTGQAPTGQAPTGQAPTGQAPTSESITPPQAREPAANAIAAPAEWEAERQEAEAQAQLVWDSEIAQRLAKGDDDWLNKGQ